MELGKGIIGCDRASDYRRVAGRVMMVQDGTGRELRREKLPSSMFGARRVIQKQLLNPARCGSGECLPVKMLVEKMGTCHFLVFFRGEWGCADVLCVSVPISLAIARVLLAA
jgi:hypothetical protein